MMTETQALLRDYVENGSEAAFRELVRRYIDFVFAAAIRLTNGHSQLAEDVVQTVFINLARSARDLPSSVLLGGWLHQNTFHVATKLMRAERRRALREQQAAELQALHHSPEGTLLQLAPLLDEAITQLPEADRTALALRFFERQDFAAIGGVLGSNEDAARMRVNRAIARLQSLISKRGIVLSIPVLAAALEATAVANVPAGFAAIVATKALAGAAVSAGLTTLILQSMNTMKMHVATATVTFLIGAGSAIVIHRPHFVSLQAENQSLRDQVARLSATNPEPGANAQQAAPPLVDSDQIRELLRLRGEVGVLKGQLAEAVARAEVAARTAAQAVQASADPGAELQRMLTSKLENSRAWMDAFFAYSQKNQGRFPTRFGLALSEASASVQAALASATNQFEIVYQGTIAQLEHPDQVIVLREKQPWPSPDRQGFRRAYGFADGHTVVQRASTLEELAAWESKRLVGQPVVGAED